LPCLSNEYEYYRSIGYSEVTNRTTNMKNSLHSSVPGFLADGLEDEGAQRLIPRPDVSQMIPYKPKVNAYPGEHPVSGKQTKILNKLLPHC
jgi:cleavage stimulation factor subunit 3